MSAPGSRNPAEGTFGTLPFASMIPTFQSTELAEYPGVSLNDLLQT
jgi:hypothetical protein